MIKRGLTLVELIAVVAVIGLLIAISTPVLYSCRNKAKAVV
jgi:prepilin-type N-terminal cleavage/methylation domain-containing protein